MSSVLPHDAAGERAAAFAVVPSTSRLGAEVRGIDLSRPLSKAQVAAVLTAFHRHGVIFFRGQKLTPDQLADFGAYFGELDIHYTAEHTMSGRPEVRILSNVKRDGKAVGAAFAGLYWHSDLSFKKVPALATLLYGVDCPPEGADTQFADMCAAYDALTEAMKAKLAGLTAVHDRNYRYAEIYPWRPPLTPEQIAKVPPVEHPLVCVHPATGRKALYVAKEIVSHIVGMNTEEGRRLIEELDHFATQPQFVYSHRWRNGDVLIWDNRCTLHRATPYENTKYTRTMHRVQVMCHETPVAA